VVTVFAVLICNGTYFEGI